MQHNLTIIEKLQNGKGDTMKNTDDSRSLQIDKILFKTEACYSGAEFDSASLDVWHDALAEFEIEEISAALRIHIKESKFLPKISEIIDIIEKNKGPQISIQSRAQQQWRIVLSAVATQGKNNPPTFSDPITANLVKTQFRWQYLCDMKQENENWEQKRWCEAFELAIESHPDMKQIEVSAKVKELAANVTKPAIEPESAAPNSVPIKKIREFRKKLRGKIQKEEDREARMAKLKEQAQQIQQEELEKYERESVEQSNEK